MKIEITIICDKDVPIMHLLNREGFEIYESKGNETLFTMIEKGNPKEITKRDIDKMKGEINLMPPLIKGKKGLAILD